MSKKIKIEFTPAQLYCLMSAIDTLSAMLGVGSDFDLETIKNVRMVDRALLKAGYKRKYK